MNKNEFSSNVLWKRFNVSKFNSLQKLLLHFRRMAFRILCYGWPLPGYTRPVRLDYIMCWLDDDDIFVDKFSRDTYRRETITVSPRSLTWSILFDFLLNDVEKKFPGRRGDREYRDLVSLVEDMNDFLRPRLMRQWKINFPLRLIVMLFFRCTMMMNWKRVVRGLG